MADSCTHPIKHNAAEGRETLWLLRTSNSVYTLRILVYGKLSQVGTLLYGGHFP